MPPIQQILAALIGVSALALFHGAFRKRLWVDAINYREEGMLPLTERMGYNPRKRLFSFIILSFFFLLVLFLTPAHGAQGHPTSQMEYDLQGLTGSQRMMGLPENPARVLEMTACIGLGEGEVHCFEIKAIRSGNDGTTLNVGRVGSPDMLLQFNVRTKTWTYSMGRAEWVSFHHPSDGNEED